MLLEEFFNQFIFDGKKGGFICNDVRFGIEAKANFLVSLGLICYTEFLGGLMPRLENETRATPRNKFNRFLYRLDEPHFRYKFFDEMLKVQFGLRNDIYSVFRCGLVHEYFIKPISLSTAGKIELKIGSVIVRDALPKGVIAFGQTKDGRLAMAFRTYFQDFRELLIEWRRKLFREEDSGWVRSFEEGLKIYR